ncbi:MAG: FHA domain-containing protein [Anaerolineae bacterium]|nr:FHA domain-containing protein [Anaerolineae bacterium]
MGLRNRNFYLRSILVILTITIFVGGSHAQNSTPGDIVINYAEGTGTTGFDQTIRVYFTLVDANRNLIPMPDPNSIVANITANSSDGTPHVYPATVSKPNSPMYISLVIDRSGSIGRAQGLSEDIKRAVDSVIDSAPEGTQFVLYAFNDEVPPLTNFTSDRNRIRQQINNLEFENGTCLYDATLQAVQQSVAEATEGRRAVVVFTDGRDELTAGRGDQCSESNLSEIISEARNRVPVFTIGLQGVDANGRSNINEDELAQLSESTGGIAASGARNQITSLFSTIFVALDSQLVAETAPGTVCLSADTFSAALRINSGGADLSKLAQGLSLPIACQPTPTPSLTPTPTATATPIPISVEIDGIRPVENNLVISLRTSGIGTIDSFRVQIENTRTGVQIPGEYGDHTYPGNSTEIVIPIANISADEVIVKVMALDSSGNILDETTSQQIAPERTSTPTSTPTSTFTPTEAPTLTPTVSPTPTNTLTPTPIVSAITDVTFDYDEGAGGFRFSIRLTNPEVVESYRVLIESNETQNTIHQQTVRLADVNDRQETLTLFVPETDLTEISGDLPPGDYTATVTLIIPGQDNNPPTGSDSARKPIPPEGPSGVDALAQQVQSNPMLAVLIIGFVLAVIALLIWFLSRNRKDKDITYYSPSTAPPTIPERPRTSVIQTFGKDTVATLRLIKSPGMPEGQVWELPRFGNMLSIGRDEDENTIVLTDPRVSGLHATIMREQSGLFAIVDENSANHTFVNNEQLASGRQYSLPTGTDIFIQLGSDTVFNFKYVEPKDETPSAPESSPKETVEFSGPGVNAGPDEAMPLPDYVVATLQVTESPVLDIGHVSTLTDSLLRIGRREDQADYIIDDKNVSRFHVALTFANDVFSIEDQDSANKTFLNGDPLAPKEPFVLQPAVDYEIGIGSKHKLNFRYEINMMDMDATEVEMDLSAINLEDPEATIAEIDISELDLKAPVEASLSIPEGISRKLFVTNAAGFAADQPVPVNSTPYRIGRATSNSLVINEEGLAPEHCVVIWRDGSFYIEDLGSPYGTSLNDMPLEVHAQILIPEGIPNQIDLGTGLGAPISLRFTYGGTSLNAFDAERTEV